MHTWQLLTHNCSAVFYDRALLETIKNMSTLQLQLHNDIYFQPCSSGQFSGTIFYLGIFPAGIPHDENSRDFLYGNRSPRELIITGIHGIVYTGNDHYGRSSRGNRPPRELPTTGIHGIFPADYLPQKASAIGFHRT